MKYRETSSRLYSAAARFLALTMAGWTAIFVLFNPTSLAARVAGESVASYVINVLILACCVLGLLDIAWHDIRGRLLWPSFPMRHRHRVCVLLYAVLAGLTGARSFVAVGGGDESTLALGAYYLMCAAGMALISIALAVEKRHV